jgi:sortase A
MSARAARWRRWLRHAPVYALGLLALTQVAAGYWIPAKAALAQHLLERAWREARAGAADVRPWPWADSTPVARLSVPSLGLTWIVLSGTSGRNLAFAPALMDGSARPGAAGVSVIAGHRDTHFEALQRLEHNARIVLERTDGVVTSYRVASIDVVDADDTLLRLDGDRPMLALVTCYPFDALAAGGSLRYVVTAAREEVRERRTELSRLAF